MLNLTLLTMRAIEYCSFFEPSTSVMEQVRNVVIKDFLIFVANRQAVSSTLIDDLLKRLPLGKLLLSPGEVVPEIVLPREIPVARAIKFGEDCF